MRLVLPALCVLSSSLATGLVTNVAAAEPTPDQLRNSWIHIGEVAGGKALVPGAQVEVPIDYHLAPGAPTTLALMGLGPWIDCPDGKYTTKRFHVDYGLRSATPVAAGDGRYVFKFTVPTRPEKRAGILWLAAFNDDKGKQWPWHERSGSRILPAPSFFTVASDAPGNFFTYDQPLALSLRTGAKAVVGEKHTATWTVIGRAGESVATGTVPFTVSAAEQQVPLPITTERRGVLGLTVAVDGWDTYETTFARVPARPQVPVDAPADFGCHGVVRPGDPESAIRAMRLARSMGFSNCRIFVSWRNLEPARGQWHLEDWDKAFALAEAEGISPSVCIGNPPVWVMRNGGYQPRYQPFDFDRDAWRESITTMATRWKGKVHSYEWLNEIVPGDDAQPVEDYVDFVRIGTETVRRIDPTAVIQLAGGLWPRNFRLALLTAGIGKWIDALPVHYSSGAGVEEAIGDLRSAGVERVAVWDNETGHGLSTWGMPLAQMLGIGAQSDWVMERWPDELQAGAKRLVFFGGWGDAAGNWDYAFDDQTPRPVAATLAVFTAKLAGAKPQGSFTIAGSERFHLFDRGGKALLIAPKKTAVSAAALRTGGTALVQSDDQGEERAVTFSEGKATLDLAARQTYIEGGDIEILRAYTTAELRTSQVALLAGRSERIDVQVRNRGSKPLSGALSVAAPSGWADVPAVEFTLAPGEERLATLRLAAPATATGGEVTAMLACRFADARLPLVEQPVQVHVLVPAELGNLLSNGDFEAGQKPWSVSGGGIAATADPLPGVGPQVLRFADAKNWTRAAQGIPLAGGRSYLYTAWARNSGMNAGSNIDQLFTDGTSKSLFTPAVFLLGNAPEWHLVSAVYKAPANLAKATFAPVANGTGTAEYDNLRVTLFEGTIYAAEAVKAAKPPVIDGALDDWAAGCPIPLLGPGQTTVLDKSYAWSPSNLRGVARMSWDEKNLYLAAEVRDDQEKTFTGDEATTGDSLVLALHPANRAPGQEAKAFEYVLSNSAPGGGSGRTTLFRPAAHAGGLSSGQLARDSSVYELAISRQGDRTIYELRMPWKELGIDGRFGTKIGCSLQLNDNDGKGRAAFISWGGGLHPTWTPGDFGVLTLVE
jgi:hypothetical protein